MPICAARSPAANKALTDSGQSNLLGFFAPHWSESGIFNGNRIFSSILCVLGREAENPLADFPGCVAREIRLDPYMMWTSMIAHPVKGLFEMIGAKSLEGEERRNYGLT
jgi:hypothetical protein